MELLHLEILDGPAVLQQQALPARLEPGEDALVDEILRLVAALFGPEMIEDGRGHLVALVGRVDLELVDAVSVEITGIAPELNRVGDVHEVQFPLVGRAALHDVVHQLQLLQMFVGLAVELEVGLEIGFV